MGLLDTISLFGAAVLAIPIALLGVEFLVFGDRPVLGAVFLALGAALLVGQHYLPDIKGELVGGASDVVLGDAADPTGGDGADVDSTSTSGAGGESTTGTDADGESATGTDDESGHSTGTDAERVSIPDAESGE